MTDFEFFFSFYGLLLGLSVAEIAAGIARTFHERRAVKVGLLTPLLAAFVCLDIASFWSAAWLDYREERFGYALLVIGMVTAMIYYVAASLVFPRNSSEWPSLDEHFWQHRRTVIFGVLLSNLVYLAVSAWFNVRDGDPALDGTTWWSAVWLGGLLGAALLKGRVLVGGSLVILVLMMVPAWVMADARRLADEKRAAAPAAVAEPTGSRQPIGR
jgi:hypothetical protein